MLSRGSASYNNRLLCGHLLLHAASSGLQDSQKDQSSSCCAGRHRRSRLMLSVVQEAMYVPVCNSVSAHMLGCAVKCVMKCWRSMQLGVRIVELFASMKTKVPIKLHIVSSRSRAQGSEVVATRMIILYKLASMTLWWTMEFHQTEFNYKMLPEYYTLESGLCCASDWPNQCITLHSVLFFQL